MPVTTARNHNHTKYISTRSGSHVSFMDKDLDKLYEIDVRVDQKNFMTISVDQSLGTITIKTNKDIKIQAKESILMEAKKITLNAETIALNGSESVKLTSPKQITLDSQDKLHQAGKEVKTKATQKLTLEGSQSAMIHGGSDGLTLQSAKQVHLKGPKVKVN